MVLHRPAKRRQCLESQQGIGSLHCQHVHAGLVGVHVNDGGDGGLRRGGNTGGAALQRRGFGSPLLGPCECGT